MKYKTLIELYNKNYSIKKKLNEMKHFKFEPKNK